MDTKKISAELLKEFRKREKISLRNLSAIVAADHGENVISAQVINHWELEMYLPSPKMLRYMATCSDARVAELGRRLLMIQGLQPA